MFVEEDQHRSLSQLFIITNLIQQLLDFGQSGLVGAVNYKNDCVDFVEVVLPQACSLTADIPKSKGLTLIINLFHIQANSWNLVLIRIFFQLVQ